MVQPAVMPNNRQLLCLIEGTRQPFKVPFSSKSSGHSLRIEIFELKCRDLAPGYGNLTPLKVNVDPNDPETPLPLLRLDPHDRVSKNCLFRRRYIQYGRDNHLLTGSTSL